MNLKNYYYYFQSAIPARICDEIVKYGKSISDEMAVTGGYERKKLNQTQVKDLKKKRNSIELNNTLLVYEFFYGRM